MADAVTSDAVPPGPAPDDEMTSLKPLPAFPGLVPPGCKEAIYNESAQAPSFLRYEHLLQTDQTLQRLHERYHRLPAQVEKSSTHGRLICERWEELRQISRRPDAG